MAPKQEAPTQKAPKTESRAVRILDFVLAVMGLFWLVVIVFVAWAVGGLFWLVVIMGGLVAITAVIMLVIWVTMPKTEQQR